MMNDEFVKIPEYENYSINILGVVRNDETGYIKKVEIINGYCIVRLQKNSKSVHLSIHRLLAIVFIPNSDNKAFVDHIDRNKLNNSIENLRWATPTENLRNRKKAENTSSIYKGVSKINTASVAAVNKWKAYLRVNKKLVIIGHFKTEEIAAEAYNDFVIEHKLDEFITLNEIAPKI